MGSTDRQRENAEMEWIKKAAMKSIRSSRMKGKKESKEQTNKTNQSFENSVSKLMISSQQWWEMWIIIIIFSQKNLLTDYLEPAKRWFQWKRQSTWMYYIWALNLVHAKMKVPTFYSEIAAELVRFYCWMMNAHIRHHLHHCCHDDDSKLYYWNWK